MKGGAAPVDLNGINIFQVYLILRFKIRGKIKTKLTEPIMSSSNRIFEEWSKSPSDRTFNVLSELRHEFKS